jgi:hypothetical protein
VLALYFVPARFVRQLRREGVLQVS